MIGWRGRLPPQRRLLQTCLALLIFIALGACARGIDREEAQLCRAIVGGLGVGLEPIEIHEMRAIEGGVPHMTGLGAGPSAGVTIHYSAKSPRSGRRHHLLTCRFAEGARGSNAIERLSGVESETGPFGPARLYMLKRFWLDRLPLESADPDPLWSFRTVPEIDAGAAYALQAVLAGLPSLGLTTLLAGAYALVYGLAGRINLAFGELALLGSAAAVAGVAIGGGSPTGGVIVGLAAAAFAAFAWSRVAARCLFARPQLRSGQAYLIASTGVLLALSESLRLLRGTRPGAIAPFLDAPFAIVRAGHFVVTATPMAIVVTVTALAFALALIIAMRRSRFGRRWRALADDPLAARLVGIDAGRLYAGALGYAGLLAGVSGGLSVLAYGSVHSASGLLLALKAIFAAILGGSGSIAGAVMAGLCIGVFEVAWSAYLPIEHKDAALLAVLALFLVLRPGGLAGAPELEMHSRT